MTKLVAEADDLIAACHGDARGCVAALILVNQQLETELAELRAKMAARPSDEQMVHAVLPVSYTHLTLPTNREV